RPYETTSRSIHVLAHVATICRSYYGTIPSPIHVLAHVATSNLSCGTVRDGISINSHEVAAS
ncbi:MAG: hypothetical protein AAF623_13395, partial [Planctomycetota bacterium]